MALFSGPFARSAEAVWQWSAPTGEGRAFLWIPENCTRVRAVVVAQHNMIEQGILEHATMRRTLAALGIAEVFVAPPFDRPFDFHRGAGERFEALMHALADASGYGELATAPVVPMGHSACASFPWNFAAWAPERTLAILSIKGDAPQTTLTGSGAPNPDWGARRIDGIPGLMVMSEQEWWEDRLAPLVQFRAAHPRAPLAMLCDTGHGHFDATDDLVDFLALFVRKAAEARLVGPASAGPSAVPHAVESVETGATLRPVDPAAGWLVDRWRRDARPRAAATRASGYSGDRTEAFWCFDEEMARATEAHHARGRGRRVQQVDFAPAGVPAPISTTHTGVELTFTPEADGVTFRLTGEFIRPLPPRPPIAAKDRPPPPTTTHPQRAADHEHAAGAVTISVITGPARQITPDAFRVEFNRTFATVDQRERDIWLLASHPGDATFKGAVQQARLRLPRFVAGAAQTITFPPIADQKPGAAPVRLAASSSAGVPVGYFVREGPAFVRDGLLHLTPVPPRSEWPLKVTIVAWQLGRGTEPKRVAAESVERSFFVFQP